MTYDFRYALARICASVLGAAAVAVGAGTAPAAAATCHSVAACVLGQNSGTGYGVEGTSAAGNGIFGETFFVATSANNAKAGVFGADGTARSSNTFDFGVLGTSTYGTGTAGRSVYRAGIAGTSTSGHGVDGVSSSGMGVVGVTLQNSTSPVNAKAGVAGFDNSARGSFDSGVYGQSARAYGVYGTSVAGIAIKAVSTSGTAVNAFSANGTGIVSSAQCIYYHCVSGYAGYFKANGTAMYVEGYSPFPSGPLASLIVHQQVQDAPTIGIAADAGEAVTASGYDYGIVAEGTGSGTGTAYFAGPNSSYLFRGGGDLFGLGKPDTVSIDAAGNMILAGKLTQGGTPNVLVRGSDGSTSMTYGSRNAQPSVEDFGEARLTAGRAFVPIDAALAKSIDASRGYLVFITPQGETNGLYVSQKTAGGFTVKEIGPSHSNVAFDYRIVAHAYGESSVARLPQFVPAIHNFKRAIFVKGRRTLGQPNAELGSKP